MDDELKALMQEVGEVGLEDDSAPEESDGVQEETQGSPENSDTALDEVTSEEANKVTTPASEVKPYDNDLE